MIKSTKVSLKFANKNKKDVLEEIRCEYLRGLKFFISLFWNTEKVESLPSKEYTDQFKSWFSKRMIQCCAKQASGIVRGTQKKQKSRLFVIEKLLLDGKIKEAAKLRRIYDESSVSMPDLSSVSMDLSSQIVSKIEFDSETSFDGWVALNSIGNKIKLVIPFKKTKHLNRLMNKGADLKSFVSICKNSITLCVEVPDAPITEDGATIGIDIGMTSIVSTSDGDQITEDPHRHSLQSICEKLARKKKGSKGFERAVKHRDNFIRWSLNQIKFDGIKHIKIEKIRKLRHKKRTSRLLSGWVSSQILNYIKAKAQENGVRISELSPSYTSQRCSKCGWVRKSNRNGKTFKCKHCGFTMDADLNAAINISLELPKLKVEEVRLKRRNLKGFFWNPESFEIQDTSL